MTQVVEHLPNIFHILALRNVGGQVLVAHACNPCYLG
jgi:hypothetical protein